MAPTKKGRKKKTSKAVVVLAILAIALFISGGILVYGYGEQTKEYERMQAAVLVDTFYEGISVDGIDVSGMSYDQALSLVMAKDAEKMAAFTASITVEDRVWNEDIPASSDAQQAVDRAYQFGRFGDVDARYAEIQTLAAAPRDFPITYTADTSSLRTIVGAIGDELDVDAVDATVGSFDRETKAFSFTDERTGKRLNRESLIGQIDQAVASEAYPIAVTGTMEIVEPNVTREQLSAKNKLLASFSTKTTNVAARNSNIRLCADAFNGSVVMPGEVFSLNEKTGNRTTDKGYQKAGTILNGKLIEEPGGGVCQVSTTLFNAVVRAGLEITERHNHSYPITYIDRGEDAMINYPDKDFKFRNNTNGPIYIVYHFEERVLTMEVYGEPILEGDITIALRSETTETIEPGAPEYRDDPSLYPGTQEEDRPARKGYRVETYIQYLDGEEVEREALLHKSVYVAYNQVVRVGPPLSTIGDGSGVGIIGGGGGEIPIIQ